MFNIITSWSNVQFNDIPYYSAFWLKNRTHFFSQYGYVWRENLYKAKKDSGRGQQRILTERVWRLSKTVKSLAITNELLTQTVNEILSCYHLNETWFYLLSSLPRSRFCLVTQAPPPPPPPPPLSLRTSAVLTIEFSNESPIMLPLKWNVISSVFTWWYLVFSKLSIQNEILFHSDAWRCHPLTWKEISEYLVWGTVEIPADSPGTNKQTLMPG